MLSALTTSTTLLFLNNKEKHSQSENKFNIKEAQKLINKELDITFYCDDIFIETKNKILKILNKFVDFEIVNIYTYFDEQSNLKLNIEILSNNEIFSLNKTLSIWTIQDLEKIFEISIYKDKYIFIKKLKFLQIEEITFPSFILSQDKKLEIIKIANNSFTNKVKEIDFSNIKWIELEGNWINHSINKLVINVNQANLTSISNTSIVELWINKLDSNKEKYQFNAEKVFVNSQVNDNELNKIINDFNLFSKYKTNNLSINFNYMDKDSIQINQIFSNQELDIFKLFNFLVINNKKIKVLKWKQNSLSKLKSKIIDCSKTIIENDAIFENNFYVQKVILNPNQSTLYKNIFRNCKNLEEIENTQSISYIKKYAFDSCLNLKYFFISKKIKFIDKLAFTNLNIEKTRIIYHKENSSIIKSIIYKDNLEEIINIEELAMFSVFNLSNNYIEIESFNDSSKILSNSFIESKNKIYQVTKINYSFKNYNSPIKITVPWFTNFISFNNLKHNINELYLPKNFRIKNILNYPQHEINKLMLPEDTNDLKLNNYCNNLVFRSYSDIYQFNYDGKYVREYSWELPLINNNLINKIKFNKWSNSFKENGILNLVNKYPNNHLIFIFLNEIKQYKDNIKLINTFNLCKNK